MSDINRYELIEVLENGQNALCRRNRKGTDYLSYINSCLRTLDNEAVCDIHTGTEHEWIQTIGQSEDDPSKWAYTPASGKRVKTSVSKLLTRLIPALKAVGVDKYGNRYYVSIIEENLALISELWGEIARLELDVFTFEVVTGDAIVHAYRTGPHSCMAGANAEQTALYAHNPESVGLVKISQGGEDMGRALVWTAVDGTRLLDRVYPSDGGSHAVKVREWAEAQGWITRDSDSAGSSGRGPFWSGDHLVKMDFDVYESAPYMDSFGNLVVNKTDLSTYACIRSREDETFTTFGFQTYGRRGSRPWMHLDLRGRAFPTWELEYVDGEYLHPDDFDALTELYNGERYLKTTFMHCDLTGDRFPARLAVQLLHGPRYINVSPEHAEMDGEGNWFVKGSGTVLTAGRSAGRTYHPSVVRTLPDGRVVLQDEYNLYTGLTSDRYEYRCVKKYGSRYDLEASSTARYVESCTRARVALPNSDVMFAMYGRQIAVENTLHARQALADAVLANVDFYKLWNSRQNATNHIESMSAKYAVPHSMMISPSMYTQAASFLRGLPNDLRGNR